MLARFRAPVCGVLLVLAGCVQAAYDDALALSVTEATSAAGSTASDAVTTDADAAGWQAGKTPTSARTGRDRGRMRENQPNRASRSIS